MKVKEDVVKAKDLYKEEHCFGEMYLYLAEELPKAIGKLSSEHRDPILWQVRSLISQQGRASSSVATVQL